MAGIRWTPDIAARAMALVSVLWLTGFSAAQTGKTDRDRFQGDWVVESAVFGGKQLPELVLQDVKATFTGDKVTVKFAGEKVDGIAKLDESKTPKTIDIAADGKTFLGIYRVEGERLRVCLNDPDQARPTKFESPDNTEIVLAVFKRPKATAQPKKPPTKSTPNPSPVPGGNKGKSDQEKFQGSWLMVSGENNGKEAPENIRDKFKMIFAKDKVAVEGVKQNSLMGTFKLDPKAKPKTIDLTLQDKPALGIYQFEGDTLKICFKEPGKEGRPSEFKAPMGSDSIYLVLKRAKATCDEEQPVLFVPTVVPGDKKVKSDKELLQGTWKMVEGVENGKIAPPKYVNNVTFTFKGNSLMMGFMGEAKEGDFKLDPTTKPKSIDMNVDGKAAKGIYLLEGDTLKICLNSRGDERPTKFDGSAGTKCVLFVLKREPAAKKEEKKTSGVQFSPADFAACCADASAPQGAQKTDKDLFQGKWEVTSAEKGGEMIRADLLDQIKIAFMGDKLLLELFGKKSEGKFKLDTTKNPKTIDLMLDDKTALGIYELTKDSLKIALAEPGQARPKDFNGTAGTENSQVTLKRGKAPKPEKKGEPKTPPKEAGKDAPTQQVKGEPTPKGKTTDKQALQGVWKLVALEVSGKKMDANDLTGIRLVFVGDKVMAYIAGLGDPEDGTFRVDATKEPRQLDLTLLGKTMKAIYRLEGDKLTVCGSEPGVGVGRPTVFQTAETKTGLLVLERAKNESPESFNANAPQSINNLKQIAIAMHNYHDVNKKLPGAAIYSKDGKPLLSWRVAILPFVEQANLYQQFKLNEPWDSEHNKKLIPQMPRVYTPYVRGEQRKSLTPYRVFTGFMTPFEGFGKDIRLQDFTDGTSNTVLVVEAADQVPWTKPEEFAFDKFKKLPKLGGQPFFDRFHIALADGSVRSVNAEFDPAVFRAMITRNGGEPVNIDKLNKPKKSDK